MSRIISRFFGVNDTSILERVSDLKCRPRDRTIFSTLPTTSSLSVRGTISVANRVDQFQGSVISDYIHFFRELQCWGWDSPS